MRLNRAAITFERPRSNSCSKTLLSIATTMQQYATSLIRVGYCAAFSSSPRTLPWSSPQVADGLLHAHFPTLRFKCSRCGNGDVQIQPDWPKPVRRHDIRCCHVPCGRPREWLHEHTGGDVLGGGYSRDSRLRRHRPGNIHGPVDCKPVDPYWIWHHCCSNGHIHCGTDWFLASGTRYPKL